MNRFESFERLITPQGFQKIAQAHVMVIGLGGVGSWCFESLVRSGVGKVTIVDFDDVCISNTNRQLQALDGNYGSLKGEALLKRASKINPDCEINFIHDFFTEKTYKEILKYRPQLIIDAIDSLDAKYLLAKECLERDINLIIVGASGGKHDPTLIQYSDLNKSFNDRLLFRLRRKLRQNLNLDQKKNWGLQCIFSSERADPLKASTQPIREYIHRNPCEIALGSACHLTGSFGFTASYLALKTLVSHDH